MSITSKNRQNSVLSTASLPDIVFMLLFFFMVATTLKKENPLVESKIPKASQAEKIEKKSLLSEIYIGKPKNRQYGEESRIFAGGRFLEANEIPQFIEQERSLLNPADRAKMIVSLK